MPQNTPNLNLEIFDEVSDTGSTFKDFRIAIAGTNSSNFQIIDTAITDNANATVAIKGAGYTNETIVDNANAITSLKNKGIYTAITAGINTLTATVSELSSVENNVILKLIPVAKNTTTVTLDVNGDGVLPIVKVRNTTGSTVYSQLEEGDLQPNQPIFITKSSDGIRYLMVNFGEDYARNVFYDNGDTTFTDMQTKATDVNNKIDNTFSADANRYDGNQKLGDSGQDDSLYVPTASATISADTVNFKIGSQSVKLLENDNVAGLVAGKLNDLTLDYTTLDNGEASADDDFIKFDFFISNLAVLEKVEIYFDNGTPFTGANGKLYAELAVNLVSGWNYLKIKKSDFSTIGAGTWSGIQSLRVSWTSLINAINEFVSFQLNQLVKKDPILDVPNYFQRNGVNELPIGSGEYYVGLEFGKNVWKRIGGSFDIVSMLGTELFSDFIINIIASTKSATTIQVGGWALDSNNFIRVAVLSDVFYLIIKEGGVQKTITVPFAIDANDKLTFTIEKDGTNVIATITNNTNGNFEQLNDTTVLTTGYLSLTGDDVVETIESISITELSHAHHSSIAETSKTVQVKTNNGAFIAEELNYGEFGVDTANNRLYMKYSGTQVIYFAGTVV